MTGTEVVNLIAATAAPVLPAGFELVKDQNLAWKPAPGKVRMLVEPQGWQQTELSGRQGRETIKVTFIAYYRENVGEGPARDFTAALAHGVTGPFRAGVVIQPAGGGNEYLNGRGPSVPWNEGKDARSHPGLFAACALVTLDHYARAAAA